jgi:cytochrome P450
MPDDRLARHRQDRTKVLDDVGAFQEAVATLISPKGHADDARLNAVFSLLRRQSPVHWAECAGVRPFWAITRHADILSVELRSAEFTASPRTYLSSEIVEIALRQISGKPQIVRGLTEMDEPDHSAYRAAIHASFAPAALGRMEHWLAANAARMVDRIAARGGICDFAVDIAAPFALRTLSYMLGVPESDDALLMGLSRSFVAPEDPDWRLAEMPTEAVRAAMLGLRDYFNALAVDRQTRPRDDLATPIANIAIHGARIPYYEMMSYFMLMATAGHVTTALAISGGMDALIANPDQLARLQRDPALLDSAIDEILRWTSPVHHFMRTASCDTQIGGTQVRAGQSLALFFGSANRDETVFANANSFEVDRSPNQHMAFGRGPHFCLGHQLARMEIRAIFSELLRRIDVIQLNGVPRRVHSTFITGVASLPIRCSMR